MQTQRTKLPNKISRLGFTLLELMVVIVIIGILMSLIIPTIQGVLRKGREAEVTAEITRLETAITSFKSDFGVEPWSEIILTEDPTATAWRPEDRTRLRRLWPQFTFSGLNDFNGDGDTNDVLPIDSSECLVFFLGGMKSSGGALTGFSKNPVNPFVLAGDSRQGPYYEFSTGRLVDTDGDGMFEYVDPLSGQTKPYHYVSSSNGQGYSKADGSLNFYVDSDLSTPLKKDSHQIISPGEDGEFGFELRPSPFTVGSTTPNYFPDVDLSGRRQETDNLANFGPAGRLEP